MIISKSKLQSYVTNRVSQFTRHHTMKDRVRQFKILIREPHMPEGFVIQDVDTTSSIHEHLGELITSNLRCYHQRQMTRIINPGRMIFSTPHNRLFRPAQITGHYRFNGVHCPLMKLLIALAQTSGEYMILSTIQLPRVTLVTRLLLIPLTTLLVIATLVVLVA